MYGLLQIGRPVSSRVRPGMYGIVQYESINARHEVVYGVKWVVPESGYDCVSEHPVRELCELEWLHESE